MRFCENAPKVSRRIESTICVFTTADAISGGRAVLGVGRGDSSLAYLGASPVRLKTFERYVDTVQRYLRGDALPFEDVVPTVEGTVPGFDTLSIGSVPEGSELLWVDRGMPKVPVEVAATGPGAIAMGGRLADRVQLTLGSFPERIRWGIDIARTAAERAGRNPEDLSLGALLIVVPCRHGKQRMLDLARPLVATGARFAIMDKQVVGPVSEHQRKVLEDLVDTYDMSAHARRGQQPSTLDDEFVDGYAIVGPPEECVERLAQLADLGLDRFAIAHLPVELPENEEAHRMFVEEVMPGLRR